MPTTATDFESVLDSVDPKKLGREMATGIVGGMSKRRYVRIRAKVNLLSVCVILHEVGVAYEVVEETAAAWWAPCWFFMAVWPAAAKGDKELAWARAHRVMFDKRYQKAMETKYGLIRNIRADNEATGMWE